MTVTTTTPVAGAGAGAAPAVDGGLAAELLRWLEERTARGLIVGQGYGGLPVAIRAVEVRCDDV